MSDDGESDGLPPTTELGRFALRVGDLESMTEFYRDVVGLETLGGEDGHRTLGADGEPIVVLSMAPDERPRTADAAGLYHAAVRVPDRNALGEALVRVRTRHHLDGASDHGFSEALYLRDPEGNGLEIYRDRNRTDWPRHPDGSVRMVAPGRIDLEALAEDAADRSTVPAGTDLGHVHLETTNLESARRFYVDVLGFDLVSRYGQDAVFVSAGGYHHHVAVNSWQGRTEPAGGRGLDWFEIRVPDAGTVDELAQRLRNASVPVDTVEDGLRLADPDGNGIRIHLAR